MYCHLWHTAGVASAVTGWETIGGEWVCGSVGLRTYPRLGLWNVYYVELAPTKKNVMVGHFA